MPDYRLVPTWERDGKICSRCGTKLSVKFKDDEKRYYCSRCIASLIEASKLKEISND